MAREDYLMAGQFSELERLKLQAQVWEPTGRELLETLGEGTGRRGVDVGCGAFGWLRLLSEWVGPTGQVIGTDIDPALLAAASSFLCTERLDNVELVQDDLFASQLEPGSFDLVHARFQLAPLGRAAEQIAAYRSLLAPGGVLVLEDPDTTSWHFSPPAPAAQRLIELTLQAFLAAGGDLDAGRSLPHLLADIGPEPSIRTAVLELPAHHPYLRLPIQFSVSLEPRLLAQVTLPELCQLRAQAEQELTDPSRSGTTFTLVQSWVALPS